MGRERHRVSDIDNEYSDENTSTTRIQARRASEWFNRPAKSLCCNLSLALRARIVSTTLATAVPRTSLRNRLCWLHDKSGVEMISIDTSTLRDAEVSTRICPF